ncbi:MAG: hypothetical protein ACI9XP_001189, partial [Lentimonas sp.]
MIYSNKTYRWIREYVWLFFFLTFINGCRKWGADNVSLNKIVIERGISKVNLILNLLGKELDETIEHNLHSESRLDGIDMSVCR